MESRKSPVILYGGVNRERHEPHRELTNLTRRSRAPTPVAKGRAGPLLIHKFVSFFLDRLLYCKGLILRILNIDSSKIYQ